MYWLYILIFSFLVIWIVKTVIPWVGFRYILNRLQKKFKLKIEIKNARLTYLKGIYIEKEGVVKFNIDYIGLSSKWTNQLANKPLTMLIGPATINILKYSLDDRVEREEKKKTNNIKEKVLISGILAKIVKIFLQHVGVVFQNLSITSWVHNTSIIWSGEIKVQLEGTSDRSIGVHVGLGNCNLTALHDESPIMFISHNLDVRCYLPPSKPINEIKYKIGVTKLNIDINDDLLVHLLREKEKKKNILKASENEAKETEISLIERNRKVMSVLQLLPEVVNISIDNFKIIYRMVEKRAILDTSNEEVELKLDCNFLFSWKRVNEKSYATTLDVLGVALNGTNHCKLILLKEVYAKAGVVFDDEDDLKLQVSNKVDNCHFDFIYTEVMAWKHHFMNITKLSAISEGVELPVESVNLGTTNSRKTMNMASIPNITIELVFENCSCDIYGTLEEAIATSLSTIYLGKFSIQTSHDNFNKETLRCDVELLDVYAYVNIGDILPEVHPSLPCQLEDDQPSCLPMSERHAWGRLFEMGKLSANCEIQTTVIACKASITYVAVEWSLAMGLSLKTLIKMMSISKQSDKSIRSKEKEVDRATLFSVDVEVEVSNVNIFSLGGKEGGYNSLLLKSNEVSFASGTKQQEMVEVKGIILSQLTELQQLKTGDTYYCCRSEEYKNNLLCSPTLSACVTTTMGIKVIDISVCETNIDWTPHLHMAIYEQSKDVESLKESLKDLQKSDQPSNQNGSSTAKRTSYEINVSVSEVSVHMQTSAEHSFSVKSKVVNIALSPDEKKIECPDVKVMFSHVELFKIQNLSITQLPMNELVGERAEMKLTNTTNVAWSIKIRSVIAVFPYKFDFGESLEKFQNVIKMLKLLHKKPKPKDYVGQILPDIIIDVEMTSIEFEDDPFEVRLGDNYMLLSDETEQAIEREQKLQAKLNQITSEKGAMLSSKKVEELRRNLLEKSAQIYIRRSKEMYLDRPPRKNLFLIAMKHLKLSIFADDSMHGRENILKHISSADSDSTLPEDIEFTTLWCRMVSGKLKTLRMHVRDYPQPFINVESFSTRGLVMGSEACGIKKATRKAAVNIGYPWKDLTVTKNMFPLKFYYDLNWSIDSCQAAWGANFEPAFAMISQSFDLLTKPSVDPSLAMPFWDKIRLLLHGNLKADIDDLHILLSASTNPYNTTEMLEIEWTAVKLEWINGQISIDGDFDLLTRTASKYDDSQVLHFPSFKMIVQMHWLCEGDSNDHHSVCPTSPEYVESQDHDSYSDFRSTNLNIGMILETSTRTMKKDELDAPFVFLYASTFRWFQNYRTNVLTRVSRPIKRGAYFKNTKPKKPPLGRHLKMLTVEFKLPQLNLSYWASFQKELGFEACFGDGTVSLVYQIHVSPHPDVMLIRRAVAEWIMRGLNCSFDDVQMELLQSMEMELSEEEEFDRNLLCLQEDDDISMTRRHFLFSVNQVTYMRQSSTNEELFAHKLLLQGFKGAWTALNRAIVFKLFEAYSKMQALKKVLSSVALKVANEPSDTKRDSSIPQADTSTPKLPLKRHQSQGFQLLEQLVSEQASKFVAQSEEGETSDLEIKRMEDDDVILQRNWHIELVNSQVLLNGTETNGSIILTSANATILKKLHAPVVINTELVTKLNKVSWSGKFRSLQYFSTTTNKTDGNTDDSNELTADNIPWLTDDVIAGDVTNSSGNGSNNSSSGENELFTKTSESTGGIVEVSVDGKMQQLQRVISRCECEFQYINLGDDLDPVAKEHVIGTPMTEDEKKSTDGNFRASLKLNHSKLELSTSPSQYAVIVDICQNLIFYTEQKKKEKQERLENAKFKLQLFGQDFKGHVSQLQTRVRSQLISLRQFERRLFDYTKKKEDIGNDSIEDKESLSRELELAIQDLQEQIDVTKEQLFSDVEELKILINAFRDVQQSVSYTPSPLKGVTQLRKKINVTFDDMQWSLTQEDGQLGIATVYVKKFKYSQLTHKDNKAEHCYEVGHFVVKNMLPNEPYREALIPYEVNIRRHLDKSVMLRIYTCVAPAVAGIMVKEHFEVNVCPIAVRITYKLVTNIERFFFPKTTVPVTTDNSMPEIPEFQPGITNESFEIDREKQEKVEESTETKKETPSIKIPPPRPPPPKIALMRSQNIARASTRRMLPTETDENNTRVSMRRKASLDETGKMQTSTKQRRPNSLTITTTPSQSDGGSQSATTPVTPKGGSLKRSLSNHMLSFSTADRDVNLMKERAARNQTFIYVKIPEVPVYFSYKGEKERTIFDANNFSLRLPTLEYHSRTWTWQDLFQAVKKDYIQTLVPQILKEKLHLKSSGAETKPSLAKVDDTNKAKLLFGEKSSHKEKKSAKKVLFGKLLKPHKSSSTEKLNEGHHSKGEDQELSGKGVEPASLEHDFNQLRDLGENLGNSSN